MTPAATTWTGRWIWAPAPGPTVLLRRAFDLESSPESAPARVTADSRYVLWCNGSEIDRGPARSLPERLAYHEVDLAPHLRAGRNAVAVLVRFYGTANRWWRPAKPVGELGKGSFLFEAPTIGVFSDASWCGCAGPWQADSDQEVVDGSAVEWGWQDHGFDDTGWLPAVELQVPPVAGMTAAPPGLPFAGMEPSGIGSLTALPRPASLVAGGEGFTTYGIGEMTHGTVYLTLEAPKGSAIEVSVGEDIAEDGRTISEPRRWTARYLAAGRGTERFETFDPIGLRYLTLTAGPDTYLRQVGVIERRYPSAGVASFSSDDPRLERLWSVGARTLELCAIDAFIDCPGREQNSWIGDSYLHTLVAMVTTSDWRLVRRNLRLGAHARRPDGFLSAISAGGGTLQAFNIPEYSLHWIRALCRYVERSGDVETARELLPTAMDVVAAFERHRGPDGLLRTPPIVFVDWAQTERGSVTAAIDALYATALLDHAQLLEYVLGDSVGSDTARRLHALTAEALELLWDEARGVYVDALHDGHGPGRRVSQQTNALAIIGRCAPATRWKEMIGYVLDSDRVKRTLSNGDLPEHEHWLYQRWEPSGFDAEHDVVLAQPFMAHFLHQAVADAGGRDQIADLCLRWWPQIERGNTTFEEFWEAPPGTASRCHAWSATPTFDLTTHVLGVHPVVESPADLGFRRARVVPAFSRVGHVVGRVPTPSGELCVDLTRSGGAVTVPAGMTEVIVELPDLEPFVLGPGTHRVDGGTRR